MEEDIKTYRKVLRDNPCDGSLVVEKQLTKSLFVGCDVKRAINGITENADNPDNYHMNSFNKYIVVSTPSTYYIATTWSDIDTINWEINRTRLSLKNEEAEVYLVYENEILDEIKRARSKKIFTEKNYFEENN